MTPAGSATVDVERVAEAVLSVDDVVALSAGPLGQYRSYLPGGSVAGVRVDPDGVRIDVVVAWGRSFAEIARSVTDAVTDLVGGLPVTVGVQDVRPATGTEANSVDGHGDRVGATPAGGAARVHPRAPSRRWR